MTNQDKSNGGSAAVKIAVALIGAAAVIIATVMGLVWSQNGSDTPSPVPPAAPINITAQSLLYYRLQDTGRVRESDLILQPNEPNRVVRRGDAVSFRATLSGRAHWYALVLATDGTLTVSFPTDAQDVARDLSSFSLECPTRGEAWIFDEGPGMHSFLIVASSAALSLDAEWWLRRFSSPWSRRAEGVWRYHGGTKNRLERLSRRAPGEGSDFRPTAFREMCDNLITLDEVRFVYGISFAVGEEG